MSAQQQPIQSVLVLGAGSAGLLAATAFKRKVPSLDVTVLRSPEIGVIGVGEGTTPNFPRFLFDYLGISRKWFYKEAEPTWKLGIRFLWGPRRQFNYSFSHQLDSHWPNLRRPTGFYCDEEFCSLDVPSAMMAADRVFARKPDGSPDVQPWHAFHLENRKFVDVIEKLARHTGVHIIDAKVTGVDRDERGGIARLRAEDGRTFAADLFVDASGFRAELLGKAMGVPFKSFDKSLFCNRACVGGWERGPDEPILPYTTAETMQCGWSWRIEHEHLVNRGYVYASDHITDEQAVQEFTTRNPKAPKNPRVIKYRSGRLESMWVGNAVAIGNAAGFVEPLEATALMVLCAELQALIDMLMKNDMVPTPSLQRVYNTYVNNEWDDIRDFLALHYLLNTRVDNEFWRRCRNETDRGSLGSLLEFYRENGPTGFARAAMRTMENDFGLEGYLVMLVGNKVPYDLRYQPKPEDRALFDAQRRTYIGAARNGMTVKEALEIVRHPDWQWNGDVAAKG